MTENSKKPEKKMVAQDKEVLEGKIYAVIAYIGVLCIVSLLLKKDNKFALFHGKQGLVLFIGEVACGLLNVIPVLGQLIWVLAVLVFGIMSLIGILQALMGNFWKMPVVGEIAEKISL
jgi:uncharacterized membrane protein